MTTATAPVWSGPESLRPLLVPIDSVTRWPNNPRRGDVAAITASLQRFGQQRPVLVQKSSGQVVAGNHTRDAMLVLGWTHMAAVDTELDDVEAKSFLLADNQINDRAQNDPDALGAMLRELAALGAISPALGFDSETLDRFLVTIGDESTVDDVGPLPEPRDVYVQPGDLWALGPHRLYVGDATDPASYDRLLGDETVQLIWTDPPYGVAIVGRTAEALTIANDERDAVALRTLLSAAFPAMVERLDPGRGLYVASPGGSMSSVFLDILDVELGVYRQTIVWVKDQFVMGHSDYHYRHELILTGAKPKKKGAKEGTPIHYGWRPGAAHFFISDRGLDTVWEIPRPKRSTEHPCLPPGELVLTSLGWRPVEDITQGDAVLAHDGNWRAVEATTSHQAEGLVEVAVEATPEPTRTTGNHPFLVARGEWVGWLPAEDLHVGDMALVPEITGAATGDVDPEWAWAVGLWAAEGATLPAGHGANFYLTWTLHEDETEMAARLRGLYPGLRTYRNGEHAVTHMLFDPKEASRYVALVGRGARAKWLAPEILRWNWNAREELLQGYLDGDGFRIRAEWRAKTASRDLATAIQLLAENLGRSVSVRRYVSTGDFIGGRKIEGKPYYDVTVSDKPRPTVEFEGRRYFARRVKAVSRVAYSGLVYNLTVEEAHTFQTVAGMTHNTMKPVELVERSIICSSRRGERVLDPFAGSGTTVIAAAHANRVARVIELDPVYAQVIINRWNAYGGQEAERL
jgi:DNA modification methylase